MLAIGVVLDLQAQRSRDVLRRRSRRGSPRRCWCPAPCRRRFAASVMNVPALAARPPAGATHTITGTVDSRNAPVICCVASRLPPGRVELDEDGRGSVPLRAGDPVGEVLGHDAVDLAGRGQDDDGGSGRPGGVTRAPGAQASASRSRTGGDGSGGSIGAFGGSTASMHPSDGPGAHHECSGASSPAPGEPPRIPASRPSAKSNTSWLHDSIRSRTASTSPRYREPPLELVGLANGHRPAVSLGHEDDPDVNPTHVRLVIVEQADQDETRGRTPRRAPRPTPARDRPRGPRHRG